MKDTEIELENLKAQFLKPGKRFAVTEAKRLVDQIYDNCKIDTLDRFHNTFFHEICPLLSIAEHIGDLISRIKFTGSHSRFDGCFLLNDGKSEQKVELTAAIDGQNDALQMELLKKRGEAPAFQKISATGTKRNRIFGENELSAVKASDYNREVLKPLLQATLDQKIAKAQTNSDYDGAWLGIVFDDWIMPITDRKHRRFDPICRAILEDGKTRYRPFSRIFFVGLSREYLFDDGTQ